MYNEGYVVLKILQPMMFVGGIAARRGAGEVHITVFSRPALGQVNKYGPNMEPIPDMLSQLGFQLE